MTAAKWTATVIAAAAMAGIAGYQWAARRPATTPSFDGPATTGAPAPAERKILYWHDPMKPEYKFDKPGKSPFMDMQLEPVYADESTARSGVTISAGTRQSLGIRTGRVEKASFTPTASAVGSVGYDEHAVVVVQARQEGFVTRLGVRAAMDRVRRGQLLAEVTVPAWIEAEGEYVALMRSDAAQTAALREAALRRLAVLGIPEAAVAELQRTMQVPTTTALHAPIDGVITELGVREGAAFMAGAVLFRINSIVTVWVTAQVPESQAARVRAGAAAEVRSATYPETAFKGRVEAILPQVDPATRTLGVRISVANSDGRLSPGMFVQVTFASAAGESRLWVPSEAVIATGERSVVIVANADGSFDVSKITTGPEVADKTAILSGLAEGQSVVLSGQFLIDSEASLRSALIRLSAQPAEPRSPAP